jgi:hypothetical protein
MGDAETGEAGEMHVGSLRTARSSLAPDRPRCPAPNADAEPVPRRAGRGPGGKFFVEEFGEFPKGIRDRIF